MKLREVMGRARVARVQGGALAMVLGACVVGGVVPVAAGQSQAESSFSERWVVVSERGGVMMRCDASSEWYAIVELPIGMTVRAVGEDLDWYEVEYPLDTPAVVPTREGVRTEDGAGVELIRRSGLRAWSLDTTGIEGMYKRVFPRAPLAPGTVLAYVSDVTNLSGELAGWKVIAPAGATGYVPSSAVRAATADEIAQAEAMLREASEEEAAAEREVELPLELESEPGVGPELERGDEPGQSESESGSVAETAVEQPAEDESLGEGEAVVGDEGGVDSVEMGGGESSEAGAGERSGNDSRGDEAEPIAADAFDAVIERLGQLEAAMDSVAEQPTEDAELDAIITEWRALAGFADEVLSEGVAGQIALYAQQRIDLLNVRLEVQRAMQQVDELDDATDTTKDRFRDIDRAVQQQRTSVVYGVLESSRVYDGVRLEKRYRLRALDGTGRTIAYIRVGGDEELDQVAMDLLGEPVGVAGTIADDSPAVPVVDAESVKLRTE